MAAKDGSFSFDFEGVYDEVAEHSNIAYTMADGRKVNITFSEEKEGTRIVETFNPEDMNSREMQQAGWQAILDRSEEHTSELQSLMRISYAVFCLKKKNTKHKKQ